MLQERKDTIDWTFTSLYKGTFENMKSITESKEGINYEMLKEKQKILFFEEVILYEDELHDCGTFYQINPKESLNFLLKLFFLFFLIQESDGELFLYIIKIIIKSR